MKKNDSLLEIIKGIPDGSLDMTPFYAEAMSNPTFVYKDIDKLYKTKKFEFYKCAKQHEAYNSTIAQERSLVKDEYFKKCLGILVYTEQKQDVEIYEEILKILKKGYKKTYAFFKNLSSEEEIDFRKYMEYLYPYIKNMEDGELNSNIATALFFANGYSRIINYDTIVKIFMARDATNKGWRRVSHKQPVPPEYEEEVKEYMKLVPKDIWQKAFGISPAEIPLWYLYDYENIAFYSLFEELNFNKNKEIEEIIVSYVLGKHSNNYEFNLTDYVIASLHIKILTKAYVKVKEMYFANNKETMYFEMEDLENELKQIKSLYEAEKDKVQKLSQKDDQKNQILMEENSKLQKKIQLLEQKLEETESDRKEIIALREFAFNCSQEEVDTDNSMSYDFTTIKGVIVGGHPNWIAKMRKKLPSWNFLVKETYVDDNLIKNADVVLINTSYIGHSLYFKIISALKGINVKLGYLNNNNIDICLKQIHNMIVTQ